jgi:hypothetical protein
VRNALLLFLLSSCAAGRVCAPVDEDEVSRFHAAHDMSRSAVDSSVRDLATHAVVCIEHGKVSFSAHGADIDDRQLGGDK